MHGEAAMTVQAPETQEWLTAREAAAILRVHRKHLYVLVARGRVPAHRLGRALRFRRADLDASLISTSVK